MTLEDVPQSTVQKIPFIEFIKLHPAIVGSLLVFFMSVIGTLYSWFLYLQFDINIFDFAEPNDFILAAFKDQLTIGLSIFTLLYFGTILFFLRLRKGRSLHRRTVIMASVVVPVSIIIISIYGGYRSARNIFDSKTPSFNVSLRDKTIYSNVRIIGSVDRFIFTYQISNKNVSALSVANIVKIDKN